MRSFRGVLVHPGTGAVTVTPHCGDRLVLQNRTTRPGYRAGCGRGRFDARSQ